ncbi:hypothetical protein EA848_16110 [Vibrio anguillarum]|nr:hypothetical protein [Vibrio anguillarum]MBF4289620.1 hypothetical protein [Vibrio anguillarum]MBF4342666.1 hypothetical protein [Vibrio anguillarum]MBF4358177.1 hypothetical protein [Vibrio anguillarum]MBF4380331.1 hypothetical protein [Vibrio anguillarum]
MFLREILKGIINAHLLDEIFISWLNDDFNDADYFYLIVLGDLSIFIVDCFSVSKNIFLLNFLIGRWYVCEINEVIYNINYR